jgi:hypothetical protein
MIVGTSVEPPGRRAAYNWPASFTSFHYCNSTKGVGTVPYMVMTAASIATSDQEVPRRYDFMPHQKHIQPSKDSRDSTRPRHEYFSPVFVRRDQHKVDLHSKEDPAFSSSQCDENLRLQGGEEGIRWTGKIRWASTRSLVNPHHLRKINPAQTRRDGIAWHGRPLGHCLLESVCRHGVRLKVLEERERSRENGEGWRGLDAFSLRFPHLLKRICICIVAAPLPSQLKRTEIPRKTIPQGPLSRQHGIWMGCSNCENSQEGMRKLWISLWSPVLPITNRGEGQGETYTWQFRLKIPSPRHKCGHSPRPRRNPRALVRSQGPAGSLTSTLYQTIEFFQSLLILLTIVFPIPRYFLSSAIFLWLRSLPATRCYYCAGPQFSFYINGLDLT